MLAPIQDYEGYYVDDKGYVYSAIRKGQRRDLGVDDESQLYELNPRPGKNGYLRVYARNTALNKRRDIYIHRAVAEAFIPNPNGYRCINHKDTNRANNAIENLEWCDHKYNNEYTMKLGHMIRDNFGRFQSGLKKTEE